MDIKIRSEHLNDYNWYVDIFHNNIAKIKQDIKTRKYIRAVYAKEIVEKHAALLERIMKRKKWETIITDSDRQVIAKDNWQELQFMNPYRILPTQEATLRALEAYRIPLKGMSAFTVIDRTLETSNTIFEKEAEALKSEGNSVDIYFDVVKKKFQKGLLGYNYIAVIEFAIFEGEKYDDKENPENNGWMIAPHLQGMIWKDGGLTKQDMQHFKEAFAGGRWRARGFKHELVYDITGSVSYMHKLPLFSYEKTYRHNNTPISQNTAYLTFQRLKNIPFKELFISGGEGQNVKTVTLNYLKEFYQEYRKESE